MRRFSFLLLVIWFGCDDGGTTPPADAATPDGATTGDAAAACTGAAYDPCTDNAQCMSNNCRMFNGANLQVCTQTCTPGSNECPMQNGQPVPCNNMGICRPAAANVCTR